MKAIVLREHGDNSRFALEEDFPDPRPEKHEVIIRVKATSLNHHDIFTRRGMPGITLSFPVIIGLDVSGEIVALGEEVAGWNIGDRVLVDPIDRVDGGLIGETRHGGLAELCRVPAHQLIALPDAVSFAEAAALPVAYGTAYRMLKHIGRIQAGERVLILGASGGGGVCCVQLAKLAGAEVIACAGDAEKAERLRQLGADDVILYRDEDFMKAIYARYGKPHRLKGAAQPGGVNVVVNFTGGDTWVKSLRVLRPRGRLLTCGATAGFAPTEDIRFIWSYELQILGSNIWDREDLHNLLQLVADRKLQVVVDRQWPLARGIDALAALEARQVFGKVVIA